MATVKLPIRPDEYCELPPYCIVCGDPADEFEPVRRKFLWYPRLIWLTIALCWLLVLILFLLTKRTRTVWTPLCEEHRSYWTIRNWTVAIIWISAVGGYSTAIVMKEFGAENWVRIVTGCSSIASIVIAAIVLHKSVKATAFDDDGITLANVHERFFEEWRDRRDDPP
jgi:hypothetical protein